MVADEPGDWVTWQQVGKGGMWSHSAPPHSGPHLTHTGYFYQLLLRLLLQKHRSVVEKLLWTTQPRPMFLWVDLYNRTDFRGNML